MLKVQKHHKQRQTSEYDTTYRQKHGLTHLCTSGPDGSIEVKSWHTVKNLVLKLQKDVRKDENIRKNVKLQKRIAEEKKQKQDLQETLQAKVRLQTRDRMRLNLRFQKRQ